MGGECVYDELFEGNINLIFASHVVILSLSKGALSKAWNKNQTCISKSSQSALRQAQDDSMRAHDDNLRVQ